MRTASLSADPSASQACHRLSQLIGNNACFIEQVNRIKRFAACDARVLITGDTGTGKELFAQAVHYTSSRASRPFVAVNCGAIPSELAENELFGHVRGAYTSALHHRKGLVAEAEGGTLFLDDIDCLRLATQATLLRLLQEGEYRPVGSNSMQRVNVRVIAATNRNLLELSSCGDFRLDLYYRLNLLRLTLPSLRERREDIALLAGHFLRRFALQTHSPARELAPDAVKKLLAHDWPGNVRELQHVIERAVLLARGATLSAADIEIECHPREAPVPTDDSFQAAKARVIAKFERNYIEQLLATSGGNVTQAAQAARKNRRAFFALMRKYDIDAEPYRAERAH